MVLLVKGIKISQENIIDLELECGLAYYSKGMWDHLQSELDNLRLYDLILLHNSCLSLTIAGISLLLEGLSDPLSSMSVLQG